MRDTARTTPNNIRKIPAPPSNDRALRNRPPPQTRPPSQPNSTPDPDPETSQACKTLERLHPKTHEPEAEEAAQPQQRRHRALLQIRPALATRIRQKGRGSAKHRNANAISKEEAPSRAPKRAAMVREEGGSRNGRERGGEAKASASAALAEQNRRERERATRAEQEGRGARAEPRVVGPRNATRPGRAVEQSKATETTTTPA